MDRRSKTYLLLATVVALLAICVAVWALFFRVPETPADPEISPVADEHLTPTDDGDDEKMEKFSRFLDRKNARKCGRIF